MTKNPQSLGNAAPIDDLISGKRWRLFAGSVMQVLYSIFFNDFIRNPAVPGM